ncbi:hypothetical protein B0H14DRAFT_2651691 [Mycena olivaceomarginata]|nr:hypothetical protein B0H14DRAFT_2651691 [Mycena olivaceomarginata]
MYSQKDTWSLQGAVLLLWLFETAHSALACSVIFRLLILNFGDFAALEMAGVEFEPSLGRAVKFMYFCVEKLILNDREIHALENVLSEEYGMLVSKATCSFYVHRLWMFTRNIFLTAIVITPSLTSHRGYTYILPLCYLGRRPTMVTVLAVFCNCHGASRSFRFNNAITMTVYLKRQQSTIRLRRTNTLVNQLVGYIVSSGVLTSIIDILALATFFAMPNNLVYIGILNFVNNLYANSMLTMYAWVPVKTDIDINLTGTPANMHDPSVVRPLSELVIFLNNRTGTIVQSTTEYRVGAILSPLFPNN